MTRTEFAEAARRLLTVSQRERIRNVHDQVDANWHGACAAHHEGDHCCVDEMVGWVDRKRRTANSGGLGLPDLTVEGRTLLDVMQRLQVRDLHDQVSEGWPDGCTAHEEGADCCVDALAGERSKEWRENTRQADLTASHNEAKQ